MRVKFAKIAATGNDFVVIDNRQGLFQPKPEWIRKVCARRIGVGADGLLLLDSSTSSDFAMRYFNSDGSEGELCGNGARAVAFFAYLSSAAPKEMLFESKSGLHKARVENEAVRVQMPHPQNARLDLYEAEKWGYTSLGYVEIGVPHFIVEVNDVDSVPVLKVGKELRHSSIFPRGANIDFITVQSDRQIEMRTYERGVENETLACGTGATAAALLSYQAKKVTPPVSVQMPGGTLQIDFTADLKTIYLSGAVQWLYSAELWMENNQWMSLKQLETIFRTRKE